MSGWFGLAGLPEIYGTANNPIEHVDRDEMGGFDVSV